MCFGSAHALPPLSCGTATGRPSSPAYGPAPSKVVWPGVLGSASDRRRGDRAAAEAGALDGGGAGPGHGRHHGGPISASQLWRICRDLRFKPWQVESSITSHDSEFSERAGDVCGLYLNCSEHAVVWLVEVKFGVQATSRVDPPDLPCPASPRARTSSTPATAVPCCSPSSSCRKAPWPALLHRLCRSDTLLSSSPTW